jgi:hypothetical protein
MGWPGGDCCDEAAEDWRCYHYADLKEASCAPSSTTSWSHCTSPSMSCWASGRGRAGRPGCRTLSWSAWPSPRCCWGIAASAAGCARWPAGWGIGSPMCAARLPTTAACAGPLPWSPPAAMPWRCPARPGVTSGGCWTPPRSPAATAARPTSARSWPAGPAMAMTAATAAGPGPQAVTTGLPGRPAGGLVPGQPDHR